MQSSQQQSSIFEPSLSSSNKSLNLANLMSKGRSDTIASRQGIRPRIDGKYPLPPEADEVRPFNKANFPIVKNGGHSEKKQLTSKSGPLEVLPYPRIGSPVFERDDFMVRRSYSPQPHRYHRSLLMGLGLEDSGYEKDSIAKPNVPISTSYSAHVDTASSKANHEENFQERERVYLAGPLSPPPESESMHPELNWNKILGSGLPSAYTHGGNSSQSQSSFPPRTLALASQLPALMRFDKEEESEPGTHTPRWAARKEYSPFIGNRTFTIPLGNRYGALEGHMVYEPSSSVHGSSHSASPKITPSTLTQPSHIATRFHQRTKADSADSSDEHDSSSISYKQLGQGTSSSTSMTSLRADTASIHRLKSSQEQHILKHDPLQYISTEESRRQIHVTPFAKGESDMRNGNESVSSQHQQTGRSLGDLKPLKVIWPERISGEIKSEIVKQKPYMRKDGKRNMLSTGTVGLPRTQDNVRIIGQLSPLAPSPPIEQGISCEISPSIVPNVSMMDKRRSKPRRFNSTPNFPSDAHEEPHKRYFHLQQLHDAETICHAPEFGGWLEPKNGCERILMPKPVLKNHEHDRKDSEDGHRSNHHNVSTYQTNLSYERHRGVPSGLWNAESQYEAQEKIRNKQLEPKDTNAHSFFHHRMPPPIPVIPGDRNKNDHTDFGSNLSSRRENMKLPGSQQENTRTPDFGHESSSDNDSDSIETVIAQGRQLDEDRERWREEYRRSLGVGTIKACLPSSHPRFSHYDSPKTRASRSILKPHQKTSEVRPSGRIRSYKSSPSLKSTAEDLHHIKRMSSRSVPRNCLEFGHPYNYDDHKHRISRIDSRSVGNLSFRRRQNESSILPRNQRDVDIHHDSLKRGYEISPQLRLIQNRRPQNNMDRAGKISGANTDNPISEIKGGKHTQGLNIKWAQKESSTSHEILAIAPQTAFSTLQRDDIVEIKVPYRADQDSRRVSLGMSQYYDPKELPDHHDSDCHVAQRDSHQTNSLPVPPRRRKDSSVTVPTFQAMSPNSFAETSDFALLSFTLPFLKDEGKAGPFRTPPLSNTPQNFFEDVPRAACSSELLESPGTVSRSVDPSSKNSQSHHKSSRQVSEEGSLSQCSNKSIATRELWNTDQQGDDAFHTLFFRPEVEDENEEQSSSQSRAPLRTPANSNKSELNTRRHSHYARDSINFMDDLVNSALDANMQPRGDDISDTISHNSSLVHDNQSAWNESSIGDHYTDFNFDDYRALYENGPFEDALDSEHSVQD